MLKIEFIGGNEVAGKLKALEPKIYNSLLQTITKLSIELQANIKRDKLSGQVLKTRTGTLRRSINFRVDQSPNAIVGRVGIGKDAEKYGVMHEFGFDGTVGVRAHLRRAKAQMSLAKYRKVMNVDKEGKTFHVNVETKGSKARTGGGMINVRAHSRHVHFPERSFMRSALRDMQPEIIAAINKAVKV